MNTGGAEHARASSADGAVEGQRPAPQTGHIPNDAELSICSRCASFTLAAIEMSPPLLRPSRVPTTGHEESAASSRLNTEWTGGTEADGCCGDPLLFNPEAVRAPAAVSPTHPRNRAISTRACATVRSGSTQSNSLCLLFIRPEHTAATRCHREVEQTPQQRDTPKKSKHTDSCSRREGLSQENPQKVGRAAKIPAARFLIRDAGIRKRNYATPPCDIGGSHLWPGVPRHARAR